MARIEAEGDRNELQPQGPYLRRPQGRDHRHEHLCRRRDLRLEERKLSEQLGISRTPIRRPWRGWSRKALSKSGRAKAFSSSANVGRDPEIITVWAALESMAARLAAGQRRRNQLSRRMTFNSAKTPEAHLDEYSTRMSVPPAHSGAVQLLHAGFDRRHPVPSHAGGPQPGHVRRRQITRSVVDHMHIIEAIEVRDAELAALGREHTMRLHDHVRKLERVLERCPVRHQGRGKAGCSIQLTTKRQGDDVVHRDGHTAKEKHGHQRRIGRHLVAKALKTKASTRLYAVRRTHHRHL